MLAGVLVGFLLPKLIGVTDYGYYKTFSLYISYVGLFHFGLEDGIYLIYGGKNFNDLDKRKFRFYCSFLMLLEAAISVVFIGISLAAVRGDLRFIFLCVAVYLFTINIGNFYQFISQITSRFTELTVIGLTRSFLTIASVAVMWLLYRYAPNGVNYKIFIIFTVGISCLTMFVYMFLYRKLTFGKTIGWKEGRADLRLFIKVGLPLMVANLCSTLILTIDRQFVNVLFDTDTYAVYAFAYNLLALITTATSAVSVVLYPMMKQTTSEHLMSNYSKLIAIVLVCVSGCLLVYFPLCPFIRWFLPQYESALPIFRIILPGLVITSAITIVMHNYYKTLGINLRFFLKSAVILVLSALVDLAVYFIFKTTVAISIASIFVILVWYILIELYFIRRFRVKWSRNFLFLQCIVGAFYGITAIPNVFIGLAVYLVVFVLSVLFIYYPYIRKHLEDRKKDKGEML